MGPLILLNMFYKITNSFHFLLTIFLEHDSLLIFILSRELITFPAIGRNIFWFLIVLSLRAPSDRWRPK